MSRTGATVQDVFAYSRPCPLAVGVPALAMILVELQASRTDQPLGCRRRSGTLLTSSPRRVRSEEHTSELQSLRHLVCRLLLENYPATTEISPLSLHDALPI